MEPKFQSSFIPKGPASTSATTSSRTPKKKSVYGIISTVVFVIAVGASLGVFGYNFYLDYRISSMGAEIEQARSAIQPEVIKQITDLETRLTTTERLIDNHLIVSPVFEFLEDSTVQSVRFTEFTFDTSEAGLSLNMRGEARGYTAVALQARNFNENNYFKNPIFSDLRLDSEGNVNFEFDATVDPAMVSYSRIIEESPEVVVPAQTPAIENSQVEVTGTSTTTPATQTATSTSPGT